MNANATVYFDCPSGHPTSSDADDRCVRCEQNRLARCTPGYLDRLHAPMQAGETAAKDVYTATIEAVFASAHAVTVALHNPANRLTALGLAAHGAYLLGILADHHAFPDDRHCVLDALAYAIDTTCVPEPSVRPDPALIG